MVYVAYSFFFVFDQVVRNNDLEDRIHLLESADEWPFLKELVLKEGTHEAEEGQQEHLLCDILMGEPFYYRVSRLISAVTSQSIIMSLPEQACNVVTQCDKSNLFAIFHMGCGI